MVVEAAEGAAAVVAVGEAEHITAGRSTPSNITIAAAVAVAVATEDVVETAAERRHRRTEATR